MLDVERKMFDVERKMFDVERYVMCTCTYIHTNTIGVIEHRIQTACVHECQGLEGWFHKDRGKDSEHFKKFCCKGTVWCSCM